MFTIVDTRIIMVSTKLSLSELFVLYNIYYKNNNKIFMNTSI